MKSEREEERRRQIIEGKKESSNISSTHPKQEEQGKTHCFSKTEKTRSGRKE